MLLRGKVKRKAMGNGEKGSEWEGSRKAPRKAQELLFSQLNSAEIGMTGGGHRAKSEV